MSWARAGGGMVLARAPRSFAQACQIALCEEGQAFAGQRAGLGRIHDVLERTRDQHSAHRGVPGGYAGHLAQDRETAIDLVSRSAIGFDGSGEVLAEAAGEKVIVVPDPAARLRLEEHTPE